MRLAHVNEASTLHVGITPYISIKRYPSRHHRRTVTQAGESADPHDDHPPRAAANELPPPVSVSPVQSLGSWIEDTDSEASLKGGWGLLGGSSGNERHPFGNALFAAALGGIAVGALLLQRQYSAYNSTRSRAISSEAPAASVIRETELHGNGEYRSHMEDYNRLPVDQSPEATHDTQIDGRRNDQSEKTSKEIHLYDGVLDSQVPQASGAPEKTTVGSSFDKDTSPSIKYPIRTSEGAAALQRIREIQKRRRELYDRAIHRSESTVPLSHYDQEPKEEEEAAHSAVQNRVVEVPPKYEDDLSTSSKLQSGWTNRDMRWEALQDEESEPVQLAVGMSTEALRERAKAASKASAESATAARRAAAASAMAADAADRATHAAQTAAIAAARCQSALDLRAADAIEEAYHAAVEAESAAESAAQRAAVGAAKAVMDQHDAERASSVACKAGELSSPYGPSKVVSSWWRQGRRQVGRAVDRVQRGYDGARGEVQGWLRGAQDVCVEGAAKMKRMTEKRAPPGSSGDNNE